MTIQVQSIWLVTEAKEKAELVDEKWQKLDACWLAQSRDDSGSHSKDTAGSTKASMKDIKEKKERGKMFRKE